MYCIDTSALIAAWEERYPIDHFPKFWNLLDFLIELGRITAPPEVLEETSKKSHELHAWLKEREEAFITDYDEAVLLGVRDILDRFPKLVASHKMAFAADPFVISLARQKKLSVVTQENLTASISKPTIPNVCNAEGIKWMPLLQLIRDEKWIIS
jgi:hypothetical protein